MRLQLEKMSQRIEMYARLECIKREEIDENFNRYSKSNLGINVLHSIEVNHAKIIIMD